jgi:hypothetical protein
MRLINTSTLDYEEFEPAVAPPYAILSHTWSSAELSFQDVQNDRKAGKEPEYPKLIEGCRAAVRHGYSYFWIDTCCIDKTNSVELSEAINSMFRWYQQAGICLAYLFDVPPGSEVLDKESQFAKSRWFTRGWTLQELLAPSEVEFFASDWTRITSRTDSSSVLADITGIPTDFLSGNDLENASIAMRMSWASRRMTTKAEDIAYCLMGIFDIQMPLLYGEGEGGAFRRLQQEIIKDSDDQSIFAWTVDDTDMPQPKTTERRVFSVLARSPAVFEHSHDVVQADSSIFEYLQGYLAGIRAPTVFDNKGLHLSLPMIPAILSIGIDALAVLACSRVGKEKEERLAIQLRDVSTNGGRYIRIEQHKLLTISRTDIIKSAAYRKISVARGKHMALHFPKLTFQSRFKLWETSIVKVAEHSRLEWCDDAFLGLLAERELNGRQIKDAVGTAHALAESKLQYLGKENLLSALDLVVRCDTLLESDFADSFADTFADSFADADPLVNYRTSEPDRGSHI